MARGLFRHAPHPLPGPRLIPESGVPNTNAPAEHIAAVGEAHNASVHVQPAAGHVVGTGAAYDATTEQADTGQAEHIAATGTAYGASASVQASAAVASATGTAPQPGASVGQSAGHASATGAAHDVAPDVKPSAIAASATGAAGAVSASVQATIGAATATGAALDATATASVNAPAEHIAATGAAPQVSVSIAATASAATVTGAAHDATVSTDTTANAEVASAIAEAWGATGPGVVQPAQRGGFRRARPAPRRTEVHAGHATARGSAHGASTVWVENEDWLFGLIDEPLFA